jgi:hypothetical protein
MFRRESSNPAWDFISNISHSLSSSSHNKVEPLVCLTGSAGSRAHLPRLPLSLSPHPLSLSLLWRGEHRLEA